MFQSTNQMLIREFGKIDSDWIQIPIPHPGYNGTPGIPSRQGYKLSYITNLTIYDNLGPKEIGFYEKNGFGQGMPCNIRSSRNKASTEPHGYLFTNTCLP